MDSSTFDIVKQLYSASAAPVAVADDKYNIIWKNPAAENCGLFKDDSVAFVFRNSSDKGVRTVFFGGTHHIVNVIEYPTDEGCFVIEYMGENPHNDISHMKSYFSFLCTRLRESASQISMAADDIDMSLKNGGTDAAASLNKIDRNVMLLLKEAIVPETLFYASDPYCRDEAINLAHKVALAVSDTENTLGRRSEVWQNSVDDVCASINSSVFETIIAYMTAEACGGELFPDRVEFVVERDSENDKRGFVSVRSVCLSNRKNSSYNLEFLKRSEFFTEAAFKEILCDRYGISFDKTVYSDGIECKIALDVLPADGGGIVKTDGREALRQERFSTMAIALSEKHYGEHYKNIKMNCRKDN